MPETNELELIDYLNTIWKWKLLIIVGTLVATIIAFAAGARTPLTYEATAILLITDSKVPRPEGGAGPTPAQLGIIPEAFEAMIKSQTLALKAIQQFGLDKEPFAMTPTHFLNNIISIKPKRGTNLLVLTAVLPDPKLATDVTNFVAQKAVELNANLNQTDTLATKEYIQLQRDNALQAMENAQVGLVAFRRTANLESLQAEQRILLAEKERLAQRYSDVTSRFKNLQSQVAALKQALTKQEQLITVTKSIFNDPATLAAAQDRGATDLKALSSIQVKDQAINEVYQMLQSTLITQEVSLTVSESERQDLADKISANEAKLILIARKIADADARLEELDRTYRLAKASYELFAKRFDEASLSVASRVTELKVIAPASTAMSRGRNAIRNGALAGTAALIACIMLTFFLDNLLETKKRRAKIAGPAPS